jgi:uncharacterized protein YqjF (DUF2071 family)
VPTTEPVSPTAPPLPGPVLMQQHWRDLTYLHWAVEPGRVAGLMPPGVRPDVLDGRTFVGLVPFRMVGAAPGRLPGVPWLGSFLETNVRLYSVDGTGRRGVVFLSLDCDRLLVALGARAAFGVPYRWARMSHAVRPAAGGAEHVYTARLRTGPVAALRGRTGRGRTPGRTVPGPAHSRVVVRVGGPKEPTELDHFVSARWGLHARRPGRTVYVPNEHARWPLHHAELLELDDGLLASVGLPGLAGRQPDHVAFSPGVFTRFGLPRDARRPRRT